MLKYLQFPTTYSEALEYNLVIAGMRMSMRDLENYSKNSANSLPLSLLNCIVGRRQVMSVGVQNLFLGSHFSPVS